MPVSTFDIQASSDDLFSGQTTGTCPSFVVDADAFIAMSSFTDGLCGKGIDEGYVSGFRFDNVTVPQGETIQNATLDVEVVFATQWNHVVYGEDVDDSAAFTGGVGDAPFTRTQTTASVALTSGPSAQSNVRQTIANVTSIVQEIVDRAGWSSGNALTILIDTLTDLESANPDGNVIVASTDSLLLAAQLTISYGGHVGEFHLILGSEFV